jgi:hypothetical protein
VTTLNVQTFASHFPDVSTDPVLASTDILALTETWMDNDETVPLTSALLDLNDRTSKLEE